MPSTRVEQLVQPHPGDDVDVFQIIGEFGLSVIRQPAVNLWVVSPGDPAAKAYLLPNAASANTYPVSSNASYAPASTYGYAAPVQDYYSAPPPRLTERTSRSRSVRERNAQHEQREARRIDSLDRALVRQICRNSRRRAPPTRLGRSTAPPSRMCSNAPCAKVSSQY